MKRTSSIMMSILLLASILAVSLTTRNVETTGTVDIMAAGSIYPPAAPIQLDYSTSSTPPPTEWNKTYGRIYDDLAKDGHQVNDGGYIVTGENYSYGNGYWAWLFKTDGYGNSQWEKHYVIGEDTHASSVVQTGDGGYILAGFVKWPDDYEDALLIKTDSQGNIQWDKTYGGLLTYERANSVVQTNDGGYIFAGYMWEPDLGVTSLWLLKTDGSGNVQWGQKYGGLGSSTGITIHADGEEYAVAARYYSDYWLLKVNASGNIMWSKTYDGGIWDYLNYMTQTNDGGYILAGNTESFGAGEKYDAWLIKTDSNGNPQWNKTYGTGGFDGASGIVQTDDSGYMISGLFHPGYMGSYADAWLFKTDDAGNVLWDVKYGGYYDDWGVRIERTSGEGYIMVGGTRSFGAGDGDAWLIKLAGRVHDVTLTSVTPSKFVVGQGYSTDINVTVANQGDYAETFNVTLYANSGGLTDFRKPITMTERSGNTLADYQVLLTIDTASLVSAGKMRLDCGDIRFTDSADFEIPYWIESGINCGETRIWVKVPSIPSSGNTTIYMYYGNPSLSSMSDGDATFCLFDDFDSLDTAKWAVSELGYGKVSVSNGELVLNATSRSWSSDVSIVSKSVWQGSYTTGARARRLAALGESHTGVIWRVNEGGYWYGLEHWVYQDCYNTADHAALSISGDTGITSSGLTAVPISNVEVISYVKRDYPRKDYYSVLDGAQQAGLLNEVANGSWTTVQNTNRIGISANNYNSYPLFDYRYDWIFISKYIDPEPTTQIGEEETGQTEIASQTANLEGGASATITFAWNTSGFAKGNYSISAYAWPVPGETSTADNNFTDGWIVVSMVGDLTGGTPDPWDFVPDGKVSGADVSVVARCFGSSPETVPPMRWEPNCDINNNGQVDGTDVATVARHFGESDT